MYEAGDGPKLSEAMVGWEIEVVNVETQQGEPAIVKRVDTEINCALVVFGSGKKDWMDLTMAKFKAVGSPIGESLSFHLSPSDIVAACALNDGDPADRAVSEAQSSVKTVIPRLNMPSRSPRPTDSGPITPMTDNNADAEPFDWFAEGGHVELCDLAGSFREGAVLCSKTATHAQLFNERRQFFEIECSSHPFKVVIHGLLSLKTIPIGQAIDVYSPMCGDFKHGTVVRTAGVGQLTPISFPPDNTVEWLDLSTQTFKLVFIPADENSNLDTQVEERSPSRYQTSSRHHRHHSNPLTTYPPLQVGQRIEIFDEESKHYVKFKVGKVLDLAAHEYLFEPSARAADSIASRSSIGWKPVVAGLSTLRCRVLLQSEQWPEYHQSLVGHRVDVYDKISKTVLSGRVQETAAADAEPSLLVRYKDGRKEWVFLKSSKVKLRLRGHDGAATPESIEADSPLRRDLRMTVNDRQPSEVHQILTISPASSEKVKNSPDRAGATQNSIVYRPKRWSDSLPSDCPVRQHSKLTGVQLSKTSSAASLEAFSMEHHLAIGNTSPRTQLDDTTVDRVFQTIELAQPKHPSGHRPKMNRRPSESQDSTRYPQQQQHRGFTNSLRAIESIALSSDNELIPETSESRSPEPFHDSTIVPTLSMLNMKPLELGQLVRYASSDTDDGTEVSEIARAKGEDEARISLPTTLDLWTEELEPAEGVVYYVHVVTGARQQPRPTWLQKVDPVTGRTFAIHTPTNDIVELKSNSDGGSSVAVSPSSRVGVPVGPIEAVRAQGSFNKIATIASR